MSKLSVKNKLKAVDMYLKGINLKIIADKFETSSPLVLYWVKNKNKLMKKLKKSSHTELSKNTETKVKVFDKQCKPIQSNNDSVHNINCYKTNGNNSTNISQHEIQPKFQSQTPGEIRQQVQDENKQFLISEYQYLKEVYDLHMEKNEFLMSKERILNNQSVEESNQLQMEIEEFNRVATSDYFTNVVERLQYVESILCC